MMSFISSRILFYCVVVLSCVVTIHSSRNTTGEYRLYNDIVYVNNPHERPRYNKSENVTVEFDFHLRTVSQFIEGRQQLVCTGWFKMTWRDEFLTWEPQMYDDMEYIRPPADYVWTPDIVAANSFNQLSRLGGTFVSLQVYSSGIVEWTPGDLFYIPCDVSIERYPFDNLVCYLELMAWTQSTAELELKPREKYAGIKQFRRSGQWSLVSTDVDEDPIETGMQSVSRVIITMTLSRQPSNFIFSFILPVLILSLLGTFVFLIPNDSGEKISFAITIPLSYGVYMSFLTTMVPQTSEGISIFVIFLSVTLALSAVFVVLSIFSVRFSTRAESMPIPKYLVTFTLWVEKVKTCGGRKKISDLTNMNDINQTGVAKEAEEEQPSWKRVSKALDLLFFWMMFLPIFSCIPLLLGVIIAGV